MRQIPRDSWQMIQKVIRRYPENIELYRNKREELLESSPSQDGLPRGKSSGEQDGAGGDRTELSIHAETAAGNRRGRKKHTKKVREEHKRSSGFASGLIGTKICRTCG